VHELEPGEVFAGHRIEAVGGRGGMGIVYKAVHIRLERTVALKVISPELAVDEGFRQRFQREAQLAASIDHPNVIEIYDADEADGQLYITMRWVQGQDLGTMLERTGRLEPETAVRVVGEVGFALDAAHARGLVHRDIKPGNILIADRDGHVYLTDFGLTREAGEGGGLTRTGMFVGTTDYAAPEQIKGGRVDARTDVYALACVLVQALTGRVPYDRDSEMSKMWAHVNDPPPRLRERVADVPEALEEVVERGMAKDPQDRYPSTGDLARASAAAVQARPTPTAERTVATGAAAPVESRAHQAGPTAGETIVSPAAAPVAPTAPGDTPPAGFPAVTAPPAPPATAPPPQSPPGPWTPPPPTGAPIPAVGGMTMAPSPPPARPKLPTWALWAGVGGATLFVVIVALAVIGLATGGGDKKPKAGQITGNPIKVGKDPQDMAFTAGNAWVANLKDGTVTRIDTATDKTRSIKAGGAPSAVAAGAGSIWTWIYTDSINRIDVKTNRVSPYFDTGPTIDAIAFGLNALWAVHGKANQVTRTDPKTNKTVATISVPGDPSSIGIGEGYVWVATEKGVVQIDPSNNSVITTIKVGGSPGGLQVTDGTVYVATGNNKISRVDASSGAVAAPITVGTSAAYYTVGAGSLWVSYPVDNVVRRIDLDTRQKVGDVKMSFNPQGLAWGQGRVWVLDTNNDRVLRIAP
jgi:serine/threonine-protein kinase